MRATVLARREVLTAHPHPAPDSWLAIDVATPPARRAQELRAAWERYVEDPHADPAPGFLRAPIAASWRRSHAAGVAPTGPRLAPVVAAEDETEARWRTHPLHAAMPVVRDCVTSTAADGGYLVVITDADGTLLCIEGSPGLRMRAAEMNFVEGTSWNERGVGTNGIGVALATDHAVQVFGPEHFLEPVQRWVCAAAPVHDPDTGEVLGAVDLTADFRTVHPAGLALAATTAAAVEGMLRLALLERDARLRRRYEERVLASPATRCLVAPSGRPLTRPPSRWGPIERLAVPPGGGEVRLFSGERALAEPVNAALDAYVVRSVERSRPARAPAGAGFAVSFLGRDKAVLERGGGTETLRPRLGEILALLCAHPEGLPPEALLAGLHGDGGRVSSVRVEVSRLRKLLGPCIDADRYRLTCEVATDARRVEALLAAGSVREAAAAYRGPLLPASEAPGVVRIRERLDAWVRHSVLTADDAEALWSWVQSAGGTADIVAWKRLLGQLPFDDPRRSHCVARVRELRAALAAEA